MKKKIISIFLLLAVIISVFSSCADKSVHYSNIEEFELAIDENQNSIKTPDVYHSLGGNTVTFTVNVYNFEGIAMCVEGYKIYENEKMNIFSLEEPNVEVGDVVTVKILSIDGYNSNLTVICEIVN